LTQIKAGLPEASSLASKLGPAMHRIRIARLTQDDANEAFGLARLAFEGLTPARWRSIARRWTARPGADAGALVARDAAGRLVGFAPFEVRRRLGAGRVLWVERVIAFALLDPTPIVDALARGVTLVARDLGCEGLDVAIETHDEQLRRALSGLSGRSESALVHYRV
jgi:hypothetical protein